MDLKLIASLALEEVMDADPKPIAPKADPLGPKPGVDPLLGGQKGAPQNLQNDLAAHDRRFHPQGYKKGDTCKYREKLAAAGKMPSLNLSAPAAKSTEPKDQGGARSQSPDPIRQQFGDAEADSVATLEQIVAAGGEKGQKAIAAVRAIYEKFPEGDARREAAGRILRSAPLPEGDDGDLGRVDETVIAPHEWPAEMTLPDSDDEGRGRWRGAWKWLKDKMAGAKDFTDWDRMENRWGSVSSNTPTFRADMTSLQDGLADGIGDVMGMRAFGGAMKREGLNDAQKAYITSLYEAWAAANESTKHRHLNQLVNYLDRLDRAEAKRKAEEQPSAAVKAAPMRPLSPTYKGALAPTSLLDPASEDGGDTNYGLDMADKLEKRLKAFGLQATFDDVNVGPSATTVDFTVPANFSLKKARGLIPNLEAATGTRISSMDFARGKEDTLRIEFTNSKMRVVGFSNVIESPEWKTKSPTMALPTAVGKDSNGKYIVHDDTKMPHEVVTGTTRSGKSVYLQSKINSTQMAKTPQQYQQVLIDPKRQEFGNQTGSPYNMFPVAFTPEAAARVLASLVSEMDNRASKLGVNLDEYDETQNVYVDGAETNLESYNAKQTNDGDKLPFVKIYIDELAALTKDKDYGQQIADDLDRLMAKSRSVGMSFTLSSQRNDVASIPGRIAANAPTRMIFKAAPDDAKASKEAKSLAGEGDFIFIDQAGEETRGRAAYISDQEKSAIPAYYRNQMAMQTAQGK